MMKTFVAAAAAGMLVSAGALAQDAAPANTQPAPQTAPQTPAQTGETAAPASSGEAQTAPAATGPAPGTTMTASGLGDNFITVPSTEKLSSAIVGLDVYNGKSEDVATIKDIAYGANGVRAYILGVGGVLGFGDRYVAVKPSAVTLTWDGNAKKWHATLDATADQLKSAPAFTYPGNS
jgi:hypothetical protein